MNARSISQRRAWRQWTGNKAARLAPMMANRFSMPKGTVAGLLVLKLRMTPEEWRAHHARLQEQARAAWGAMTPAEKAEARQNLVAATRRFWARQALSSRRQHGLICVRGKYKGHDAQLWAKLDEAAQVIIDLTHPRYQASQARVWASLRAIQRSEKTSGDFNPHDYRSPAWIRSRDALYKNHQRFREKISLLLQAEPNASDFNQALLVYGRPL